MSYDFDAIFDAARDDNGLQPTLNAQQVLRIVFAVFDAVDEGWAGRGGTPPLAAYVAAVRDQMTADYNGILRAALEGTTTSNTNQEVN